jgi:hypothetical protein
MRKSSLIAATFLSLTFGRSAVASLTASPNALDLVNQANLVVLGKVRVIANTGSASTAEVVVTRVVVGNGVLPLTRLTARSALPVTEAVDTQWHFGMIFITLKQNGETSSENEIIGELPASPLPSRFATDGASRVSAVACELASVFGMPVDLASDVKRGIGRSISVPNDNLREAGARPIVMADTTQRAEDTYLRAAIALRRLPFVASRACLESMVEEQPKQLGEFWASGQLIREGQTEYLARLVPFLMSIEADKSFTADFIVLEIKSAGFTESDLPILVKLLDSPSAKVRQFAAYALRQKESLAVVGALVKKVDDEDRGVRTEATRGVCYITRLCKGSEVTYFAQVGNGHLLTSRYNNWLANQVNAAALQRNGLAP